MAQVCLLLDCTAVLEARLLPKLNSRCRLTLAATSRAVRHWLITLPPVFWQACILLMKPSSKEQVVLLSLLLSSLFMHSSLII